VRLGSRGTGAGDDVPVVTGKGKATIPVWRDIPGRPVLLEFVSRNGLATVTTVGAAGRDRMLASVYLYTEFAVVPGTAAELKIESEDEWTARFMTAADLSEFDGRFASAESAALVHRQGSTSSLLRVFNGDRTEVEFYQDCKCPGACREIYGHRVFEWTCDHDDASAFGPTTQEILWPGRSGVIVVNSRGDWSLEPAV
jgi:hypothetical protein